jgi:hypothetical protein
VAEALVVNRLLDELDNKVFVELEVSEVEDLDSAVVKRASVLVYWFVGVVVVVPRMVVVEARSMSSVVVWTLRR